MIWGRPTPNKRTSMNLCSWSTFHERFFSRKLNWIDISCCSYPSFGEMIVMTFCTWHDYWENFCMDMISTIKLHLSQIRWKLDFILGKSFMKWAPGLRLSIKMSAYRYTWVLWYRVSYLYNGNPNYWKMTRYILSRAVNPSHSLP